MGGEPPRRQRLRPRRSRRTRSIGPTALDARPAPRSWRSEPSYLGRVASIRRAATRDRCTRRQSHVKCVLSRLDHGSLFSGAITSPRSRMPRISLSLLLHINSPLHHVRRSSSTSCAYSTGSGTSDFATQTCRFVLLAVDRAQRRLHGTRESHPRGITFYVSGLRAQRSRWRAVLQPYCPPWSRDNWLRLSSSASIQTLDRQRVTSAAPRPHRRAIRLTSLPTARRRASRHSLPPPSLVHAPNRELGVYRHHRDGALPACGAYVTRSSPSS